MKFSIIVPVYKVEKYLPQCIESVINQSYSDFELILVDDGSPDKSGVICDAYAERDKRIRVIHKKNGGVSEARNAGISMAQGEYIWFLDSDDFMVESALNSVNELVERTNQDLDMITCAHINYYYNGDTELASLPRDYSGIMDRNKYLAQLYSSSGSYWASWKNIFRRTIIVDNNLQFPKGLICAEDCDFFMHFLLNGHSFVFFNNPTIYYRIDREESVTNILSKTAIMDQLIVYRRNYDFFRDDTSPNAKNMQVFFANKFANTISLFYHLENNTDLYEVTKYIKEHKGILNNVKGMKYKLAKLIWRLLGYSNGSKLLNKLKRKL